MTHHLVGLTEIAALLAVTRQRVNQLAKTDGFPPPEVELASGRVWRSDAILAWAKSTGRL